MPTRSKTVVGGLMIFASLGSVTSVVRLFYLHTISYPTGDFFVNASKLSILCTIEPGVGITVASLATVRPLFTSLVEKSRRPWTTRHTSPHGIPSGGNTCTHAASSHIYKGNGALGTSSDTTVVTLSPMYPTSGPFSKHDSQVGKEEKIEDIEAEMRAYGMSDLIKPTILDEGEFDHYPPEVRRAKETERKMRWFRSPRTAPHAFLRDSKEYMLRTGTPPRPHSQILSDRSQRISGSVEEWRNGFMSHRHGSGDCSTCHSLHQGLGEPQERARYSDI
ncbi:Aldehyde dehydrogenase [Venturia inaequalis]|nr:Aldehyde dehydrogenase [Venturia inaequalis]